MALRVLSRRNFGELAKTSSSSSSSDHGQQIISKLLQTFPRNAADDSCRTAKRFGAMAKSAAARGPIWGLAALISSPLRLESTTPTPVLTTPMMTMTPWRHSTAAFHTSSRHRAAAQKDFYKILGVVRDADAKVIKQAYFKMAKKYHPDSHPKDDLKAKERFQEVSEAYDVLSDEDKKRDYDIELDATTARSNKYSADRNAFRGSFRGSNVEAEDLFDRVFGKYSEFAKDDFEYDEGFEGSKARHANDRDEYGSLREIAVDLTFVEAARGIKKNVELIYDETCHRCNGKRIEPNSKPIKCHHCSGSGIETISRGPYVLRQTCRHCHGSRTISKDPCKTCRGKGTSTVKRAAEIAVPAGVEDGQSIRTHVDGREFFIKFAVEKSKKFRRQGSDVHSDSEISLSQAVLGGIVRVNGLYDDYRLNVPAGTQSHEYIVLKGKGMKRVHSNGYGDHYVHVKIRTPTNMSVEQEALLSAFAETEEGVEGTINGLTEVALKSSASRVKRRVVKDDAGFVAEIRRVIGIGNVDEADDVGRS